MQFRTLFMSMLLLVVSAVPVLAQTDPRARVPVPAPNLASSLERERAARAALAEQQRAAQAERERQAREQRLAEAKAKMEAEVLRRAERAAVADPSAEARRRAAAAEQAKAVTEIIGKARADFVAISQGADKVLAQGNDINPVAAMNRMRTLYGQLENLHDRMVVLRRSIPDGERQLS